MVLGAVRRFFLEEEEEEEWTRVRCGWCGEKKWRRGRGKKSTGICMECLQEHYPEVLEFQDPRTPGRT